MYCVNEVSGYGIFVESSTTRGWVGTVRVPSAFEIVVIGAQEEVGVHADS